MKLSEFLEDLGRPVAYYPELARALDDVKEAIFVCQMAYWKGKEKDPDGWVYKTREEIETETALSYKEQINVRAGLLKKKLMTEYHARTEHRMYFKIDWDAVNTLWEEHLTKSKLPEHLTKSKVPASVWSGGTLPKVISPTDESAPGSLPKVISLNRNPENTSQITSETTREGEVISVSNIWERVLEEIKVDAPRAAFDNYIQTTQAIRFDGNTLMIAAASAGARDWLEDRLTRSAENLLIGIMNAEVTVVFVIAEEVSA